jgi:hypothetical protein
MLLYKKARDISRHNREKRDGKALKASCSNENSSLLTTGNVKKIREIANSEFFGKSLI